MTLEELLVKMRASWIRNAQGDLHIQIGPVRCVITPTES